MNRRTHRTLVFAAVAVSAAALFGGCTSIQRGPAAPADQAAPPSDQPPSVVEQPKDRDSVAVMAALRQIDACALIDPAVARAAGFPASASIGTRGPHQCSYLDFKAMGDVINTTVGASFGHGARYSSAPIEIGPARAYLFDSQRGRFCEVHIPVSFTLSIRVEVEQRPDSTGDKCAQAEAVATAAMTKLANPDALRVDAAKQPLAQWDACSLLAAATGEEGKKDILTPGTQFLYTGIDTCTLKGPERRTEREFDAHLSYNTDPFVGGAETITIEGVAVKKSETSRTCRLQWAHGTLPDASGSHAPYVGLQGPLGYQGTGCTTTEALAAAMMQALAGPPPNNGAPQRPLLIAPEEPDSPAPGPCVHFNNQGGFDGCVPAPPRSVPDDPQALIDAAQDDQAVTCAAAADVVHKHLGDALQPIVYGEHCLFLEPTHTLQVTVSIIPYVPNHYGLDPGGNATDLFENRKTVEVAGHPGVSFEASGEGRREFELYLSTGNDANQPGAVHVAFAFHSPRGVERETVPQPDVSKAPVLTTLADEFMATHIN